MGEFGAVSVISGNIIGQTQTLTLFVESAYKVGGSAGVAGGGTGSAEGRRQEQRPRVASARLAPLARCALSSPPSSHPLATGAQQRSARAPPPPPPPPLCLHQEYNTEAAFAAAVLLSFLALFTLLVKDRLESVAGQETSK